MIILDILIKVLTILIAFVGGLWALSKYIIERGMVPASELDIQCNFLGKKNDCKIIEFLVLVSNVGNVVLVPQKIRIRLKTLGDGDISLFGDQKKRGRLVFPQLLQKQQKISFIKKNGAAQENNRDDEFLELIPSVSNKKQKTSNTFVQPGVKQKYTFVTAVEPDVEFVHASAQFNYNVEFRRISKRVLAMSKRLGLIQYDLNSIEKPHSVERAFSVQSETTETNSG